MTGTMALSPGGRPPNHTPSNEPAGALAAPPVARRVVPPIEASVAPEVYQAGDFLERYYECRYRLDVREPGHDYRLLFHSNGLIVVMLAPSHPLMTGGVAVTSVDFQVTQHTNRLDNKASGKGKRGAQLVTPEAPLFRATCADGSLLVVPACARGKLVQLNERLRQRPGLLATEHCFLAILLPKLGASSGQREGTVDRVEYERLRADVLAARRAGGTDGWGADGEIKAEDATAEDNATGDATAEDKAAGDATAKVTDATAEVTDATAEDKAARDVPGDVSAKVEATVAEARGKTVA